MRHTGTYLAFVHRLAPDTVIGEMDSLYSQWLSRDPDGFSDRAVAALRNLVPALSLAMKSAAMSRVSKTVAKVYLGRDTARRVLGGKIVRGVADRITAVHLVFGSTGLLQADRHGPPERNHAAPQRLRRRQRSPPSITREATC